MPDTIQKYKDYVMTGFLKSVAPIVIERASGATVTDVNGREYLDCFAGISGDMHLGAMLDLGVPLPHLRGELGKLGLTGYRLEVSRDSRNAISGTRVEVALDDTGHEPRPPHEQGHNHGHHHHDVQVRDHLHEHRSYASIRRLIENSALSAPVKARSLDIFRLLAEAEAKVHDQPVDNVQFHEVGAVDSIVDIVGAAICLELVKPDRILASTVELGGGLVKSQHGLLPVPAPATALLLAGAPVKSNAVPFEQTTPTGAAILAACVQEFTDVKGFVIRKVAYGVGHREVAIPNVLRLFLAEGRRQPADGSRQPAEAATLLECNIDDMSPELHGYLAETLFEAGAADVFFTPIVMKKSRPAVMLSVLCAPQDEERLADIVLRESTTFGLRRTEVAKTRLDRELSTIVTSLGEVRVKTGLRAGRRLKAKPEYEDCRRIARERGMPLREVYDTIRREME